MATDTSGNQQVDFVWGNVPLQPNTDRTGDGAEVVVAPNAPDNNGWSGYSVYPSEELDPALDNHVIAVTGYNGFPGFTAGGATGPTGSAGGTIVSLSGALDLTALGVVLGNYMATVPTSPGGGSYVLVIPTAAASNIDAVQIGDVVVATDTANGITGTFTVGGDNGEILGLAQTDGTWTTMNNVGPSGQFYGASTPWGPGSTLTITRP